MSEGPIRRERAAWKREPVSTTDAARVCMAGRDSTAGRSYCGRVNVKNARVHDWAEVVCWDCLAAAIADGLRLPTAVLDRMPR